MSDNVSTLKVVPGASVNSDAFLQDVKAFLNEILEIDTVDDDCVSLEQPASDEVRLGKLTSEEKEIFILFSVLGVTIEDEMIELGAETAEKIAALARKNRIDVNQATQVYIAQQQAGDPDLQNYLMRLIATHAMLRTLYEWKVRRRLGAWNNEMIVRNGFMVYSFKTP